MAKTKKQTELEQQIGELTADLQRVRADFENYRKRVDGEKVAMYKSGEVKTILKLLPVIDTIERAISHIPEDIAEHKWVQGVAGMSKQLDKSLKGLDLQRIDTTPGVVFDPALHEAVQFNEDSTGETEVIESEMQAGYLYEGQPIRHAMVRVTRK